MNDKINPPGVDALQQQMSIQNSRLAAAYQQKEAAEKIIMEAKGVVATLQFSMTEIGKEHEARAAAEAGPQDDPSADRRPKTGNKKLDNAVDKAAGD